MNKAHLTVHSIDGEALPEYPIGKGERLAAHYFMAFHFNRWLNSRFRMLASPEVRAFGFDLFCISQNQDPVGTLPDDDRLLARHLNLNLGDWQDLRRREIGPLYNWTQYLCDDGVVRLGHPVVVELASEALSAKNNRAKASAAARERKRWERLRVQIPQAGAHSSAAKNQAVIEKLDRWLEENCPGNRTIEMVKRGLEALAS